MISLIPVKNKHGQCDATNDLLGFFKCVRKKRVISSGLVFRRASQPTISGLTMPRVSKWQVLFCNKKVQPFTRFPVVLKFAPHAAWGQFDAALDSLIQGC